MFRWTFLCLMSATTAFASPLQVDAAGDVALPDAPDVGPDGIWNGTRAQAGDYPSTLALFVGGRQRGNWFGGTFCSATLVHPEWVVTAAHCLADVNSMTGPGVDLYVGVGTTFPYDQQILWDSYVLHPDYDVNGNPGDGADIGLVKLVTPLLDVPTVPINFAAMDSAWVGGETLLSGFGITRDDANDSGTKRYTSLPIIRFERDLVLMYDGSVTYDRRSGTYRESFPFDGQSNVCSGDSGGSTYMLDGNGDLMLVAANAIVVGGCVNGSAGSTRTDLHEAFIRAYVPLDASGTPEPVDDPRVDLYTLDELPEGTLDVPERGAPILPSVGAAYPQITECGHARSPAWLAVVALLGLRRRRR